MKDEPAPRLRLGALLPGLAIFALTAAAGLSGTVQNVENMCLDAWVRLATVPSPPPDILIAAVDEPSFQELRLPWPWPRSLHAKLLERLTQAGARAVVFDIVFADPGPEAADAALASALAASGRTVLAASLDVADSQAFFRKIVVAPLPLFSESAAAVGLAMLTPDPDGVVRRFTPAIDGLPSLAAATLGLVAPNKPGKAASLPSGLIPYPGPALTIPHVSYYQVIDPDHPLPRELIQGKIVLVGRSLAASPDPQSAADAFRTPFSGADGRLMAGVEIHAAIVNAMLGGGVRQEAGTGLRLAVALIVLLAASLLLRGRRPVSGALLGVGLALAVFLASGPLFAFGGLWLPPATLSAGVLLVCGASLTEGYLAESRRRAFIKSAFSKYLAPTVVARLLERPEMLTLGGEEVDATVLFMDLAGFTTLSERLAPAELIALLSDLFGPLADIVRDHEGTLDKFIGDAIMAFWGAPLPLPDHARKACAAALAMNRAVAARGARPDGAPAIKARFGLHSGALVVGNIGSRDRFNYTCLGDSVNLASRLESANKIYASRILCSGETAGRLDGAFLIRELDALRVKGRREPTRIFEVLGHADETPPPGLELFAEARQAYAARDFAKAAGLFREVLALGPDDGPAGVFLARCRRFQESPPPEDWDGVWPGDGPPPGGEKAGK